VPLRQQSIPLSEFLSALFHALGREGLRPCILRNYEGFPSINMGNDVDLFIRPSELPRAMRALRSVEGIRIVGYAERRYVANVFLEGVSTSPGMRLQHIDFNLRLTWKGLPYLTTDAVLEAAISRSAGNLTFLVPCPAHEAVISLLASLLVGGWLKEKYFSEVQRKFARDRSDVIAALLPQFGLKPATRLVDSVIGGDCRRVLGCVRPLRVSLALRSLLRGPLRSASAIVRHYANELAVRLSPGNLETVCILGPDGCDKTTIVETLMPMLHSSAAQVEKQRRTPWLPFKRQPRESDSRAGSSAEAPTGSLTSMARVVLWLLEEWLYRFIGKKNLTLRISENSYADLLVDPEKYRYGGPTWFARLAGKLFPSADLWILLDQAAEDIQVRSREFSGTETLRQLEAYRSFVKTRKRHVILDASRTVEIVAEGAYAAIIDTLAKRAGRKLKSRF
jgi:hypothetical protein